MERKKRLSLKFKSVIIIVLMAVVLCSAAVLMSAFRFSTTNEGAFKDRCRDIASTAAANAYAEDVKKVTNMVFETFATVKDDEIVTVDDIDTPEYDAFLERFAWITETPEYKSCYDYLSNIYNGGIEALSTIYFVAYDTSRSEPYAMYIACAPDEDETVPGVIERFYESDDIDIAYHPEKGIDPYIYNEETYGWLVVSGMPVFDDNGNYVAMVGVDLSMDDVKAHEHNFIIMLAMLLVLITIVICVIFIIVVTRSIVKPINKLSDVAADYIKDSEKKATFASIDISRKDEIGDLAEAMKKMENDINEHIKNITKMTAEKERIGAELGVATRIQADLLPTDFPSSREYSIYASMTPAKEVGGDFYDYFVIDDDHIGLVMADVSGKGVPAALFMVIAKTLIKNRAMSGGSSAEIMEDVNEQLCENNEYGLFVTAWFGIYEISTGKFDICNAGHDYPAVRRHGGDFELAGTMNEINQPPLATMEGMTYENEIITLNKGDEVFLYTDGVPEAGSMSEKSYGMERMIDVLNANKDLPLETRLKNIKQDIDDFTGGSDPFDDITMMMIKIGE